MPVPQENLLFVEQASCLFVPQENLLVEQASCLFLRMVQDVSYNRQIRAKTRFLELSPAANFLQSQEMHPAQGIPRYNTHPIRRNRTALEATLPAETSNLFAAE